MNVYVESNFVLEHLGEIGRSKPHHEVPATFDALSAVLIDSVQIKRDGLRQTISEFLAKAEIIPLDVVVLRSAADIEVTFGLSGQDAIVLASVLGHLESNRPDQSCFLNRNFRDFDDQDIRDRLEGLHCKFFPNFLRAYSYIASRVNS